MARDPVGQAQPGRSPESVEWATPRRVGLSARTGLQPLELAGGETALPRSYVYCTLGEVPGSPQPQCAERVKNDPGWRHSGLKTGHNPNFTAPGETARILDGLAAASRTAAPRQRRSGRPAGPSPARTGSSRWISPRRTLRLPAHVGLVRTQTMYATDAPPACQRLASEPLVQPEQPHDKAEATIFPKTPNAILSQPGPASSDSGSKPPTSHRRQRVRPASPPTASGGAPPPRPAARGGAPRRDARRPAG